MGKVLTTKHGFKRTHFNFYEKQKFKSPYTLGFLILLELFFIYMLTVQELSGRFWGMKPLDTELLLAIIFLVPTPLLIIFLITGFETIVNEDGIFFRWLPYNKTYNIYDWSGIREVSIIEITKIGIGKKRSKKYGESHCLGSKFGLSIQTKSGKRKVIGTGRPEEMNRILIRVANDMYNNSSDHSFDYS
jgi:hypothetical protein